MGFLGFGKHREREGLLNQLLGQSPKGLKFIEIEMGLEEEESSTFKSLLEAIRKKDSKEIKRLIRLLKKDIALSNRLSPLVEKVLDEIAEDDDDRRIKNEQRVKRVIETLGSVSSSLADMLAFTNSKFKKSQAVYDSELKELGIKLADRKSQPTSYIPSFFICKSPCYIEVIFRKGRFMVLEGGDIALSAASFTGTVKDFWDDRIKHSNTDLHVCMLYLGFT